MRAAVFISLFGILCIVVACAKYTCPEPITKAVSDSLTLTASNDAHISSMSPNSTIPSNYPTLFLHAWTSAGNTQILRSLINFDMTQIPSGSTIESAKLYLYSDTTKYNTASYKGHQPLTGSNAWTLYRIYTPWNESSVTWNTCPSFDNSNSISFPATTSISQPYIIDVLNLVKDQYQNPSSYYGFLLKLNDENIFRQVAFASSENPNAALHPKLVVTYFK